MKKYILLCVPLVLLFSCELAPVETISWEEDGQGFLRYSTNDRNNYGTAHICTFGESYQAPMGILEVTLKKVSGPTFVPYGIVYCYSDINNFYRFLINAEGYFQIMKKVDGVYSVLVWPSYTPELRQGLGVENVIRIVQDDTRYTFALNSVEIGWVVQDMALPNRGQAGFYVAIGTDADETFRPVPEDVRFRMSSPIEIP